VHFDGLLAKAAELHAGAKAEYNSGHHARAEKMVRRALRLLDAAPRSTERDILAARLWISQAIIDADFRGQQTGLDTLSRARELALSTGDRGTILLAMSQLGAIEIRGRRIDEAIAALSGAAEMLDAGSLHDRHVVELNYSIAYLIKRDLPRARAALQRAIQAAREDGNTIGEMKSMHNLGCLEATAGNLP